MAEPAESSSKMSRRKFGALAVSGVGALAVGGVTVFQIIDDDPGQAVRRFDVHHDPSVYVTMTSGAEFVVEVKQMGTQRLLERHEGVTAHNLLALKSEHVTIDKTA
jgi:hypothetical protein